MFYYFRNFFACFTSAFLLCGSTALAESVTWLTDDLQDRGIACHFKDTPRIPQDAFVVVAGDEISFVFSSLGSVFRTRKTGSQISNCAIVLPVDIAVGYYVNRITQSLWFGISKTVGVYAHLKFSSNFARRLRTGESLPADLIKHVAEAEVKFPVNKEFTISSQEIKVQHVLVGRNANPESIWARFCSKQRMRKLNFYTNAAIVVNKVDPNAEVSIAVDGLDVKYVMGSFVKPCEALQ